MATYAEKLLDPRWQRKRLERLNASDFACDLCGDKTVTLHVHHRRYIKGRQPWEYAIEELQTLCKECHASHHEEREVLDRLVAESDPTDLISIVGLVGGYLDARISIDPGLAEMARQIDRSAFAKGYIAGHISQCTADGLRALFTNMHQFPDWMAEELLESIEALRE